MKKPDALVWPITDGIFVTIPEELTPEVDDPVVHGETIPGRVLIAKRIRPLTKLLEQAVDESMAMMPERDQVKARAVRSAEWAVLTTVDQAERYELFHDCEVCREGKQELVDFLRSNPGRAAAICKLEFDEYIEAFKVGTAGDFTARGGVLTGDRVPENVVGGETCSMCHHALDPHEMWLFGDPTGPGAPPGRMTCPEEGCECQSEFSFQQR